MDPMATALEELIPMLMGLIAELGQRWGRFASGEQILTGYHVAQNIFRLC